MSSITVVVSNPRTGRDPGVQSLTSMLRSSSTLVALATVAARALARLARELQLCQS